MADRMQPGRLHGIYLLQMVGGTVVRDSHDSIGITLTLSAEHRVRHRSGSLVFDDCPRVGSVTIHGPGDRVHIAVAGRSSVLRLELPIEAVTSWLVEDFEVDGDRLAFRDTLHADDPRLMRLLVGAMAGDEACSGRMIAAHLLTAYGASPRAHWAAGGIAPNRLRRVRDIVEQAPPGSLDLRSLAAQVGMSPYHFSREFKRTVGETPMRYVERRLALRCLALLERDSAPIGELAQRMGFAHASHLARHLRGLVGLSPARYRELVRS